MWQKEGKSKAAHVLGGLGEVLAWLGAGLWRRGRSCSFHNPELPTATLTELTSATKTARSSMQLPLAHWIRRLNSRPCQASHASYSVLQIPKGPLEDSA
jgi:hypothetical protein